MVFRDMLLFRGGKASLVLACVVLMVIAFVGSAVAQPYSDVNKVRKANMQKVKAGILPSTPKIQGEGEPDLPRVPSPGWGCWDCFGGGGGGGGGGGIGIFPPLYPAPPVTPRDCVPGVQTAQCKCPPQAVPEFRTNLYGCSNADCSLPCAVPVIIRAGILQISYQAHKDYEICDGSGHIPTGVQICSGGQYDNWYATYSFSVDHGCPDIPQEILSLRESGSGAPTSSITTRWMGVPPVQITPCRGN